MNSEKQKFFEASRKLRLKKKLNIFKFLGKKLIILPKVFDPEYFDSKLLARTINKTDFNVNDVLDLGTGCGIQAIFISKKAKKITATDINSSALYNTKVNVELTNLKNIEIIKSDLFSNINKKFDLIVFNPPFFSRKPKDLIEKTITSYKNDILKRFFKDAGKYLKKDGKIIIVFSDIGNIDYFNELARTYFSKINILTNKKCNGNNYFIYLIENN